MSRVVVVGAGAAGLATAARLGRLRHDVVVVEQEATVGGRWRPTEIATGDGLAFRFDAQPAELRLPAALRDLFLKTGRKAENAFDLVATEQVAEHVLPEGERLVLPNAGHTVAVEAVARAFGADAGTEWDRFLSAGERRWELARTPLLEAPPAGVVRTPRLSPRRTLRRATGRLHDRRLRAVARQYGAAAGWPPDAAPATVAALPFVEQAFRVWTSPGGPAAVVEGIHDRALAARALVVTGTRAEQVTTSGSRVDGVLLADGRRLPAEVVVCDVGDPAARATLLPPGHGLPAARVVDHVDVLLGLRRRTAATPTRRVLHGVDGAATLTVSVDPDAGPDGHEAVVVSAPPGTTELTPDQALNRLADDDPDVRDRVALTETRTVRGAVAVPNWFARPGPATGVGGLFTVGRSAAFGRDLSFVVMSAAAVAEQVGRA